MDEVFVAQGATLFIVQYPPKYVKPRGVPEERRRNGLDGRRKRLRELFAQMDPASIGHRLLARGAVDAYARLAHQNCDTDAGLTRAGYPPAVPFRPFLGQLRDVLSEKGFERELEDIKWVIADVADYTADPARLYRPPRRCISRT
ncbi:MAG: hypothetical protein ACOCYP_06025 [Planctomycetota bacterium]